MTKQLNEVDKTRSADESSDKNYNYFKQNEFPRPLVLPIGEKAETKVSKDKSFETESNWLNSYTRDSLALGRKTVPGIVSHHDSRCKHSNDTWEVENLTSAIG